jgi:hypothetical protein
VSGGRSHAAVIALVAAAVLAAHLPALRGEFLLDDVGEIAENPAIRTLWPPQVPMFAGGQLPHRPLPYYSFALNHAAHGLATPGYHAVNLAIHLVNGLLLWWILRRLCGGATADPTAAELVPASGAALWLLHPLATQPVDYVYQRMELMAATAILAAVACFLAAGGRGGRGATRPARWLAGCVTAAALGMLSKETAVVIPGVLLLTGWWLRATRRATGHPALRAGAVAAIFWPAVTATVGIAIAVVAIQRERFSELAGPTVGRLTYAFNQPLVILDYLSRAAWPARLCFDHYRLPSQQPAAPAAACAGVAAVLAIAVVRRREWASFSFGTSLFLLLLAPTSSLVPVTDLEVEHRMYLPLAVLVAGGVAATWAAARRWLGDTPLVRRLWLGSMLAVVGGLAVTTSLRAAVYATRLGMWADVVDKAPRNPRAWAILADELRKRGAADQALAAVDRSLAIEPQAAVAHGLRADLLLLLDRPAESLAAAEIAAGIDAVRGRGLVRRGAALLALGRREQALAILREAVVTDRQDDRANRLLRMAESAPENAPIAGGGQPAADAGAPPR